MWWGCRCLRLVVWFVAGAHVTEIRGLVSYRWCDGLIFVTGLALGWYIFACFLPIAPESIVCCVLTAYRLRIHSVLNRSKICHKWDPRNDPHAQIFTGWPTGSNILSLGGNYWEIQYTRYWLQPFAKNLIAYRVRIEAFIMRIELFSILVFQQLRIEPNIRRIERVSNCVSQPSLWFPAYRNLRIETVSRDMRICVSYRGNAKAVSYTHLTLPTILLV